MVVNVKLVLELKTVFNHFIWCKLIKNIMLDRCMQGDED